MKTNVAQSSIDAYRNIGEMRANQKTRILAAMKYGVAYTRQEIGEMTGIKQTAAGRAINEMLKEPDAPVFECGRKVCPHSSIRVGAVMLSMLEGA